MADSKPVVTIVRTAFMAHVCRTIRHEIGVHTPKQGAIIVVHLFAAAIVRNDHVIVHVTPLHLRGGLARPHGRDKGLSIPVTIGTNQRSAT
jgi:hypothetical protein